MTKSAHNGPRMAIAMLAFSTKPVIEDELHHLPNFSCVGFTVHSCFRVCGKPSGIGRKMGKRGYISSVGTIVSFDSS